MKHRTRKALRTLNAAKRQPAHQDLLRLDPSRTLSLRTQLARELDRRFARLRLAVVALVSDDDALSMEVPLTGNARGADLLAERLLASPFTLSWEERRGVTVNVEQLPVIEVPDVRQRDHYSCGAACAMSVGLHFGVGPDTLDAWKRLLGTDVEESTRPSAIVGAFRDLGCVVEVPWEPVTNAQERDERGRFTHLSDGEKDALVRWTGPESDTIRAVDEEPRLKGSLSQTMSKVYDDFHSALSKLPDYSGEVHRGIYGMSPAKVLSLPYKEGEVIKFASTTSTSTDPVHAQAVAQRELGAKYHEEAGAVFHISTRSGKDVSEFQDIPYLRGEKEVVLPRGIKYRVTRVEDRQVKKLDDDGMEYGKSKLIRHVHLEEFPTMNGASGWTVEDLRGFVARGMPVIVCVQDYGPRVSARARFDYGHYMVVVGVVGDQYLILQDPSEDNVVAGGDAKSLAAVGSVQEPGRILVSVEDFERIWRDRDVDGNKYVRYGIAVGMAGVTNVQERDEHGRFASTFSGVASVSDLRKVNGGIGSFQDDEKFYDSVIIPLHNHNDSQPLLDFAEKKPNRFAKLRIASLYRLHRDCKALSARDPGEHEPAPEDFADFLRDGVVRLHQGVLPDSEGGGHSWTLQKGTALAFSRHGGRIGGRGEPVEGGRVETKTVHVRDVMLYSDQQGEAEVVLKRPTANELARDDLGRFAGGGGLASRVGKALGHAEHLATARIADAVARLPKSVQAVVHGAWRAAMAGYTAGQALVERVAKERGMSEGQAQALRTALASKDIAIAGGLKAVALPVASVAWVAFSTVRHPLATLRAAQGLVRDALKSRAAPGPYAAFMQRNADEITALADAVQATDGDPWFGALFACARDAGLSVAEAVEVASEVWREREAPDAGEGEDDGEGVWNAAYASTQLDIDDQEIREAVRDLQARFDPADVVELETDSHVTVRYGLHADVSAERVQALLRGTGPLRLTFGRLAVFQNPDADVLVVEVACPQLGAVHGRLGILPNTETHPVYRPHMTVAYLKPGTAVKYLGEQPFAGLVRVLDAVTHSDADRERTVLTLNDDQARRLKAFQRWLRQQTDEDVLDGSEQLLERYAREGYTRGAGRAFDDLHGSERALALADEARMASYDGSRRQFLEDSFGGPVAVDKVKLLAARSHTDLKGVTEAMSAQMTRTLTDGLVRGKSPRQVAKDLAKDVDGIGRTRARAVAHTEIMRAHAEGQLDSLKRLGADRIGVEVEWLTSGSPCPECAAMGGRTYTVDEARGLLPAHPNCTCCFVPSLGKVGVANAVCESGQTSKQTGCVPRGGTPEQRAAMDRVLNAMPGRARALAAENLRTVSYHEDLESLTAEVRARGTFVRPGALVLGHYDPRDRSARLNGATKKSHSVEGAVENVHGTYAHELTHALDRDDDGTVGRFSRTEEWRSAYRAELSAEQLTAYATLSKDPREGFAEFGRAVYGSDVPRVLLESKFPKCVAFFRKEELWPS